MKFFCINLIFILAFHLAYCQSKIIGIGHSNGMSVPSNNQSQPAFLSGNDYMVPSYNQSKPAFQPAVIITKDGDTLSGLIKYAYAGVFNKIIYKSNLIASDSIFSVHKIKSIITQFVYLENIPFKGKEIMMPWLAVGKINLFIVGGLSEIIYVLQKNRNQFVYANKKDFKVMMRHIFFDTPDMLKNIGKKGYRFNDMIRIVREYNKRFQ
jgi:hypothetical protein